MAACGRQDQRNDLPQDTTLAGIAAGVVRSQYQASDVSAAGAWTWEVPGTGVYVLIDVQSQIQDLVQARAELWLVNDSTVSRVGRSDVMPSAAEFGAFAFEDLTGDGLPDLFGYVADSAGIRYPVFVPGARGGMVELIADAAPGWRFSSEDPELPEVITGPLGACALRLWAEGPVPDGVAEGWRYLTLLRDGLGAPRVQPPDCGP